MEILGMTETKKMGSGLVRIHKGNWSGADKKGRAKSKAGVIVFQ